MERCVGISTPCITLSRRRRSAEVHDAALQFVRKIAGTSKPSKANEAAFNRAVTEIAHATQHLLDDLVFDGAAQEPR